MLELGDVHLEDLGHHEMMPHAVQEAEAITFHVVQDIIMMEVDSHDKTPMAVHPLELVQPHQQFPSIQKPQLSRRMAGVRCRRVREMAEVVVTKPLVLLHLEQVTTLRKAFFDAVNIETKNLSA